MARWALALVALTCWAQSLDELMQEAVRLRQAGKLEESIQQCKKLRELAGRQKNVTAEIVARRGLASVYHQQARYPAERQELEAALALAKTSGDRREMGKISNDLGIVVYMMGEWDRARQHWREALAHFEAAGEERHAINTIVNLVFVPLDRAEKEKLMAEGLRWARRLGDEMQEGRLLHLAADDDYGEGNFARSLERLQRAIELFEKIGEKQKLADALTSLGRLHRAHGLPERALEYHQRALRIREQLGDRERIMQSLNAIAVTYGNMGQHRRALDYDQRALAIARQTGSQELLRFHLQQLGIGYSNVREFRRAAETLEEALAVVAQAPRGELHSALSEAYTGLGRLEAALGEAEKAVELSRLGSGVTSDNLPASLWQRAIVKKSLGRPAEALADLRQAMDYLESLRARLAPADYMKGGFTDYWLRLYDLAIEIYHGARMHERAFEAAEQARARAFVDLLATRESLNGANPELKSFASVGPFTARLMAEQVERLDSTLLAYWVGEEAAYLWVFRPGVAVQGFRLPASKERLRRLAAEAADKNKLDRKESFCELYKLLVEPARSLLPKQEGSLLTIVPHGPLFQVSFAALADERGRYLAEDYALHYVPAGAVLAFTGRKKRQDLARAPAYLVVADPTSAPPLPDGQPMPPLPGARREAEAVAGAAPGSAVTLAGPEAQPENVRRMAAGKAVLHFATHSIIRDDRPMESFLALEGGKLTAQDVYGLTLEADLVFLSACRTGLGRISGDGIVGLTRAFFYAGVPSVVATLGEIADAPTARLVEEFYRRFRESGNKSAALRAAQLQLLSELRAGKVKAGSITLSEHPVFWANFVLQGEP
ncbi:MAG: CHAT domain-containing protein [Acidobacteria bacterium]|nr:CHAT domain-containing protein [Acidobacteriota bacterium]